MLRSLLGEPPRVNGGLFGRALEQMVELLGKLEREITQNNDPTHDFRKLEIWTRGLITSLDEMEQCTFAARHFRQKVQTGFVEDMEAEERTDYARYVFFYKDGFIRLFSLLDKLGTLLNELYGLNTARVKPHFSYFTVLRQLRNVKLYPELQGQLEATKEQYKDALALLRRRRNTEIHYMNSEMQDDLWQRHRALHGKIELEDLDRQLKDLEDGFKMVCESVNIAFSYSNQRWRTTKNAIKQNGMK